METFPIVRRKDEAAHGGYRTKRVILEMADQMAAPSARPPRPTMRAGEHVQAVMVSVGVNGADGRPSLRRSSRRSADVQGWGRVPAPQQ